MRREHKIRDEHLARRAVVYLRQSSEGQVRNNLESQRMQYALEERARALGFGQVDVIDSDLGASAGIASRRREGFERLLGSVALGEVGLILSRELSRLLRTDKDFCQLVELCQVFGTLLGDEDNLYDTSTMDDQLVLGIKATLSVVELKVLRMRLREGKENKARRGELYPRLPPGYVWDGLHVVKDPDVRVQEALSLVLTKFRETWSIRQTFKWFRDNEVELPVTKARQGKLALVWQIPRQTFIGYVLHNPFYAGAYTWGRRQTEVVWRDGALHKRQKSRLPPEQSRVFLRDHHPGYIEWATFEDNQRMIRRNYLKGESDETAGVARAGSGLLAGLLRCRRCGQRLQVRYWGKAGTAARYLCSGDFVNGGNHYCVGFGGALVDLRFAEELVDVLSPHGIRASLEAAERMDAHEAQRLQSMRRQLEQVEYEVTRSFEQFNAVDARNRLVASELERRWNDKLQERDRLRVAMIDLEVRCRPSTAEERRVIQALGQRFADVWNHPACPVELKKQIIRTVIEEIVVDEDPPGTLSFVVHWKGGSHTALCMTKANPKTHHRTTEADLDVIRNMASRYGDDDIARVLNKLGRRTGKGKPWSAVSVQTARRKHRIEGHAKTVDDPELLTLQGAARHTETSDTTIKKLVQANILAMNQVVPFAPWEIRRTDLESEPVRTALERLKRTGRLALGGQSPLQKELFTKNQGHDHAR